MMIDTSFPFLAQILPLYLLYSLIFSLLVFSYLLSFQKHQSTCETLEKPISLQFYYFLFISNLLFLYYSFYLYNSFSFVFFLHLFFLSFFSFFFFPFCLCHPSFPYFGLHYLPHFLKHLVIFTSSIFQLISGLWKVSHDILKITQ